MIIDDLVVLGRACPEPIKDGRITICLGGYSYTHGFIRIYPTKWNMDIKRWALIKVEVERDDRDTRQESWKIVGSKSDWHSLHKYVQRVGELPKAEQVILVNKLVSGCVQEINQAKRSLGIIKPDVKRTYFRNNAQYGGLYQGVLPGFEDAKDIKVKRDFPHEPRVVYSCTPECLVKQHHDQQVLEWGFYRWFEKEPSKYEQVWENARFNDPNYDLFFFVGNQAQHRTSFLVISVLRFKNQPVQPSLFPMTMGKV